MKQMFNGCSNLETHTMSNFNTSSVTNMASMFNGCSSLNSLDLSKFDFSNITDATNMFWSYNGTIYVASAKEADFVHNLKSNLKIYYGSIDNWEEYK